MNDQSRSSHNKGQTSYFSHRVKPTMVPRATPYISRQIDRLLSATGIGPGSTVLEVGCGMGRYTLDLARRGLDVSGLDLVPFLLEKLREYAAGSFEIPLYCTDVIEHPDELDDRFDAVIGFFVLHHLFDLEASFAAMRKMVRPGGVVAFLEPNAFNPLYYVQVTVTPGMTWAGDKGIVHMRPGVVFPAMKAAGLESPKVERFGFFPPFLYNHPIGRKIDHVLERIVWKRVLPFQVFKGTRSLRGL